MMKTTRVLTTFCLAATLALSACSGTENTGAPAEKPAETAEEVVEEHDPMPDFDKKDLVKPQREMKSFIAAREKREAEEAAAKKAAEEKAKAEAEKAEAEKAKPAPAPAPAAPAPAPRKQAPAPRPAPKSAPKPAPKPAPAPKQPSNNQWKPVKDVTPPDPYADYNNGTATKPSPLCATRGYVIPEGSTEAEVRRALKCD